MSSLTIAQQQQQSSAAFRPRSQTFPMTTGPLDAYASPPTSSSDAPGTAKFLGSDAMDSPSEHMLSNSPVVTNRSTASKQSSMIDPLSPHFGLPVSSEGIQIHGLPSLVTSSPSSAAGGGSAPSVQETQRALQVVWNFFQHQPLEPEEYVMMGKLMEKLKLHHQSSAVSESFSMSPGAFAVGRSLAE
jgi:hypothetical protein